MDEPSQLAREHTRLLRQSVEPPTGTRARNWEHIESALEFAEVAGVQGSTWLSAHAIKAFLITVGVGTLGLVGVDLVIDPGSGTPPAPKIEHPQPAAEPPAPAPAPAPQVVSPSPSPEAAKPTPAKPKGPRAEDPLAAELALTDQIKQAYRAGDLARAAELAERHRARFPAGVFAPERDAILAEHACERGDFGAADAFVKRQGGSPLAKRVAAACRTADDLLPERRTQ